MAKLKSNVKGVTVEDTLDSAILDTEEVDNKSLPENDTTTEDEIEVDVDIVQKSPLKLVKILPKVDHSCVIGGTRYTLKKGVQQNVPLDVKNILSRNDLLLPL